MMRFFLVALCAMVFWAVAAEAQESLTQDCRSISDSAARLACFDAIVAPKPLGGAAQLPVTGNVAAEPQPQGTPQAAPGSTPSRWRIESERDLMGGPVRVFVAQTALSFNGPAPRDPSLTLRCGLEGNRLEILFNPQIFLGRPVRSSDADDVNVRIRFAEEPPFESLWSPSTGRNAAFSADPRRFYEQMLRYDTVVIEAQAHGSRDRVAAQFALGGLAEAAESLAACLPALPEPEITRQYGIQANLLDFSSSWLLVPRGTDGVLAQQRMVVTHGMIDTETGNQTALYFWCEGSTLQSRVRFNSNLPAQIMSLYIDINGGDLRERTSNFRRVDSRTLALPEPRKIARFFLPERRNAVVIMAAFVRNAGAFAFAAAFVQPSMNEEQIAVLQPCLNPPRPAQQPRRQG